MGVIVHHAILVTGTDHSERRFTAAHEEALRLGMGPSPVLTHNDGLNGYKSFFVPPDGSKEFWMESDEGNRRREAFKRFLRSLAYEDGSTSVKWIEVQFAGESDGYPTEILDHSGKIS